MHEKKILVVDYGSQYTQLKSRRIIEKKDNNEVHQPESLNDLKNIKM